MGAAASLASIYGVIAACICSSARERAVASRNCCQNLCIKSYAHDWLFSFAAYHASSRRWGALAPQRKTRRFTGDREFGVATATVFGMRPRARFRHTVRPVQRSNGVSPNPNPRGVEGRDLLLCPPVLGSRTEHIPPLVCVF